MDLKTKEFFKVVRRTARNFSKENLEGLKELVEEMERIPCPECKSEDVSKHGHSKNGKRIYLCKKCGLNFTFLTHIQKEIMKNYPRCLECKSNKDVIKRGKRSVKKGENQIFWCKKCNRYYTQKKKQ